MKEDNVQMFSDINGLQSQVEYLTRKLDDCKLRNDTLEQKLGKKVADFFRGKMQKF